MKLSISNIAWSEEHDDEMYTILKKEGFDGVEIAPTRLFPEHPYDRIKEAKEYAYRLKNEYGLSISSMQSIWYGKSERIWGTNEERHDLLEYTKKAIDFAKTIQCGNLVFGCPKNRCIPENGDINIAIEFFSELGEYAAQNNTCLALEANPTIYNTNFINTTESAISLIEQVHSDGFKLNLDVGTMIENDENVDILQGNNNYINHVHVSEPYLKAIKNRTIHSELAEYFNENKYNKYVSIEMGKIENINDILKILEYVKEIYI